MNGRGGPADASPEASTGRGRLSACLAYLFVEFGRPMAWIAGVGAIRPGMIVSIWGLATVVLTKTRPIPRPVWYMLGFLPLMAWIESRADWHAAVLVSAVLMFLIYGLAALLIVADHPREVGLSPVRASDEEPVSDDAPEWGFDVRGALRTGVFWTMSTGLMLFFLGQGAVTTLGVDFFDSREVGAGALIIALAALVRTILRLPLGLGLSRVDRIFRLAVLVSLSQALAPA